MSTYLDRIRARTRRANAKRSKRSAAASGRAYKATRDIHADSITLASSAHLEADGRKVEGERRELDTPPASEHSAGELEAAVTTEVPPVSTPAPMPAGAEDINLSELEQPAPASELPAEAPTIRLEFSKSSNIRSAEMRVDGVVSVQFANGTTYQYANFTAELMAEWEAAKSAGSWFHQNVRTKADRHPIVSPVEG